MRKLLIVLMCVAAGSALAGGQLLADLPAPTEEQIEAQLKEARKRVEAAQAEERAIQKRLEDARAEARGQIKAEVQGVLCWREDGGGYYVRVRPRNDPKREIRVSLVVGEDKVTVRNLEGLQGKAVVVKGILLQRPTNELYMDDFTFEGAKVPR